MFTNIFTKQFRLRVIIISVNLVLVMMVGTGPVFAQTPLFTLTESMVQDPAMVTINSQTLLAPLDSAKISFQEVTSGLIEPVFITNAGDGSGRIFIIEKAGYIRILKNGTLLGIPFLDIHTIIKSGGEQGLLALAFHPSYSTNGIFFVAYTAPKNGDSTGSNLVLQRFSVSANNPDLANPNSGVILLTISHPVNSNHNGGTLAFGGDGYLYWSTGDGGSGGDPSNNAQQLNNLLGKILRIDVNSGSPYGIPASNPFFSSIDPNVKKEIWAYGLRNPWRMSFDKLTHDLYIGDVGQAAREEVDFQPAGSTGGENYGWRVMEGSLCYNPSSGCDQSGKILPVAEYNHTLGCSITGGHVYRGSNFPSLSGYYFYGDFCSGRLFSLYNDPALGWTSVQLLDTPYTLSTFGDDEQGELYLADFGTGKIYNIRYQDTPIVSSSVLASGNPTDAINVNFTVTFTESVTGVDAGDFSLTTSGVSGATVSSVGSTGSVYTVTVNTGTGSGTIRLNVVDNDTIKDVANNPLGGVGAGNGNFIGGETYTILKTFVSATRWITNFDLSHSWTVQNSARTVGDVNNDGRDDLVGFRQDGVYVSLSTGSGFGAVSRWTTAFDLLHGWTVADFVRTVGDVNNDGRDDLIGFGLDGVYVALSTGSGFGAVNRWTTAFDLSHGWTVADFVRTVGDVNNDGRDDLIGFGLDGVYVSLSTGSGFDPISRWTTAFDLSHGWTVADFVRTVGDVNNDGRADLVGFGLDGVYVSLSNGTGFDPVNRWTTAFNYAAQGWRVDQHPRMVGDVNGDGQDDLVGFGLDWVYMAASNGASFNQMNMGTTDFNYAIQGWRVDQHPRMVGDVNGDGKADLIGFGLDGVYVATAK